MAFSPDCSHIAVASADDRSVFLVDGGCRRLFDHQLRMLIIVVEVPSPHKHAPQLLHIIGVLGSLCVAMRAVLVSRSHSSSRFDRASHDAAAGMRHSSRSGSP